MTTAITDSGIPMNPTCPRCEGKHGVEVTGDGYEHDCAACGQHLICAIGLDGGEMFAWHREDGSCGCEREPHTCDMDEEERSELRRERSTEPVAEPASGRNPKERKTLEDALNVATEVVDRAGPVDADLYVLAAGFLVLCGDMAAMLDAAKQATQYCGWCQRANADSRMGLATYTLDEVREHTQQCEHNPLVVELRERPAADLSAEDREALRFARGEVAYRRGQVARVSSFLDEHNAAIAVLDKLCAAGGGQ